MGYKLWVNNERIGLSQPKKNGKYDIEVDFPVAQKVELSQKRRKKLSKARQKNQLMPPKDVRCSRGLAYFMRDQTEEIEEKSSDILDESMEKGMSSLTITHCEQDKEKTQRLGPICPPGFSDLPPLPSNNVGKGISYLTVDDFEQGQEKNQGRGPACPPEFSDLPPLPVYNTRARNNIEDAYEVEDDKVKIPASVKVFQDIIDNWGREYDVGREYVMGPWF